MPREMKITNGPSFRHLIFSSKIVNEHYSEVTFTMDKKMPPCISGIQGRFGYQMAVEMVGSITEDHDDFVIIGKKVGSTYKKISSGMKHTLHLYIYVIHYNARTRKGHCTEYTQREFFSSPVTRYMFKPQVPVVEAVA